MSRRPLLVTCPCCHGRVTPLDVDGLLYELVLTPTDDAVANAVLEAVGSSRGAGIGALLSSMAAEDDGLLGVGVEGGPQRVREAVASVSAKLDGSRLVIVRSDGPRSGWRIVIAT